MTSKKIGFIGLGLIGGSIAKAIRQYYPEYDIIAFDKNKESLKMRGGIGYYILAVLNAICRVYLTIIRGTPVVVQLMIAYFIVFVSAKDGVPVGMLAFGINSGAYVAEIFRAGIMSIDNGQFEAGRSLGFNYFQTMRYIVVPQMFKSVLPTLCNEFIALLKETSVVGYVGVIDITKAGNVIAGVTYSYYIPLLTVAAIYLVMVMILSYFVGKLEKRLRKNER